MSLRLTRAPRSAVRLRWRWCAVDARGSARGCRFRCPAARLKSRWCNRCSTMPRENASMLDVSERRINALAALQDAADILAAKLAVLPDAAKLSFRGRPASLQVAGDAFGTALPQPACRFSTKGNRAAYWLGPDEWLLQATGEQAATLYADMASALTGQS